MRWIAPPHRLLRLSYYRRMTINVEFLLARHPLLFLWRKSCIKCLDRGNVLTAVCGGGGDIHPLFAVQHVRNKLANEKRRREVVSKTAKTIEAD